MDSHRSRGRRCLSVALDAGHVSIPPIDVYQSSTTFGLHGRKLICIICTIITLFLISFINLTYLLWFMSKLDWSIFDYSGSKVLQFDKIAQQFKFHKEVICKEALYATAINHPVQIDISIDKQIDVCGEQSSIFFDADQILFNADNLYLKNHTSIDFTNLRSYKFDDHIDTRVRLNHVHSQNIHHRRLNITATNQLTISNVQQAFFYSHSLVLQANRHNRRSVIRFYDDPKSRKKSFHRQQKSSHGNLRFKSDSVFFDLRRFPSVENNHRSRSSGIYRLCICNTTFLTLRSFAHQLCPLC